MHVCAIVVFYSKDVDTFFILSCFFVVIVAQDVFLLPIHVSPSKKNPKHYS